MFDGAAAEHHFQKLIAPKNSSTLPLNHPLFLPFDPYSSSHHHHLLQTNNNIIDLLHHQKDDEVVHHNNKEQVPNSEIELPDLNMVMMVDNPWSNDEVLALLRIRSSMENCWLFPSDLTWEHVSRKLGELGFKKSAEKCKEKFEDESKYFDNIKNYKFLSELEELCQPNHNQNPKIENSHQQIYIENENRNQTESSKKSKERKKRKRHDRFEMFKGFSENIVNKMMAQQEETHKKLLQDMLKRDKEKVAKEEEWKKQEMEKMNKELEIMAQELKDAGKRQATIVQFLNKYAYENSANSNAYHKAGTKFLILPNSPEDNNTTPNHHQIPTENPSSSETLVQLPSSSNSSPDPNNPSNSEKDDIGRRWPRDEVLALINLRCNNNANENKEENNNNKIPLWERISKGMSEIGYKKSAKRCKEKWENINKYFRKTKDLNKKRSLDSRTCLLESDIDLTLLKS